MMLLPKPFRHLWLISLLISAGVTLLYAYLFQSLYPTLGVTVGGLSFVVVGLIGFIFGPWGGGMAGLVVILVSAELYSKAIDAPVNLLLYWPVDLSIVGFGVGVGWLRNRLWMERQWALEREAMLVTLRRQSEEMDLLNQIRTALAQEVELDKIVETAIRLLSEHFAHVSLYLREENDFRQTFQVGDGVFGDRISEYSVIGTWILQEAEVFFWELGENEILDLEIVKGVTSLIVAPLLEQSRVVGLLSLASFGDQKLSQADVQLVKKVGQHIQIALERAKLFAEVKDLNETLEHRVIERTNALAQANFELFRLVTQRQNLLDMTRTALFTLSLDGLLVQVIAMLGNLLGQDDYLGFFWLNERTGRLEPYKCVPDEAPNHQPWVPVQVGEGVTGFVAINRMPVLGNFVHDDPRFANVICPFVHVISIPIQARDKLIGVFNAGRLHNPPFSQEDFETIEIFLSLAAIAIDNANLFEQVKQRESLLETRIAERTASLQVEVLERKQAEKELQLAYTDLKLKTEALERSNADLEQFAYVSYHDLQEPLRQVMLYTQRLIRSSDETWGEEKIEWMAFVLEGTQRMQSLIKGLLHYSNIGRMKVTLHPVNSDQVFQETLSSLHLDIKTNGITVYHELLPWVLSDTFLLRELFQNLLGNAIKFSGEHRPVIRISAIPFLPPDQDEEANAWRFAIQDNGIGIDTQYFDRIFDIFQRLHSRDAYEGTGVGLAICKKIVEHHHGGRIWVASQEGEGATFYFTLPRVSHFLEIPQNGFSERERLQ